MADESIERWAIAFLENLPGDGGDQEAGPVLEGTYGFDAEEFEAVVEAAAEAAFEEVAPFEETVVEVENSAVKHFALMFFELGYAWHIRQGEKMPKMNDPEAG